MSKLALVVDDSLVVRKLLARALTTLGFEVIGAADGQDGLTKAKAADLALIITDVNMPVMDGLDFVRFVRKEPRHRSTPIVVLTTEAGDDMKGRGMDAGVTAWFVKPFNADTVADVVRRVGA
jgi:two-component system chemotaxis response regulator CheY